MSQNRNTAETLHGDSENFIDNISEFLEEYDIPKYLSYAAEALSFGYLATKTFQSIFGRRKP